MKTAVYDKQGKEVEQIVLPKDIFEVPMNSDLVHQVFISQTANLRQVGAHTKNRSEVRGGGRKPWRQKGTGRARHGSTRSPIWKGGGVSGGPRNEAVYEKIVPAKMRKKALSMVLSEKVKKNLFIVMDEFNTEKAKTKDMAMAIKKSPIKVDSRLVISPNADKKIFLMSRNIERTGVAEARNLNVMDLLNHKYVLISKDGLKDIEKSFSK